MKKISDRIYEADEGKYILSKVTKKRYTKIVLSQNDSIDKYEEISNIPPREKTKPTEKWSKGE